MRFDLMNNISPARAISPVSVATDAPVVSEIFDTRAMLAVALIILTGSIADADATFAVLIEEGDQADLSDAAAVADAQLIGTEALAGFAFGDDDALRKIGYIGSKRYVRATITPTGNAAAALIAAVWLGEPQDKPSANPPA